MNAWKRFALLPLLFLLAGLFQFLATAQSSDSGRLNNVRGTVVDDSGKPVDHATVDLKDSAGRIAAEANTDAAGNFVLLHVPSGTYQAVAALSGVRSAVVALSVPASNQVTPLHLILRKQTAESKPAAPSVSAMQFSDQPNFTIAGVSDWTAVGGHGSDSVLRTTESLARDTLTLKPAEASLGSTAPSAASTRLSERKLLAAVSEAPNSFETNQQLGDFYLQQGRFTDALPPLKHAFEIKPEDAHNIYDLALTCEQLGYVDEARRHIHDFLQHQQNADLHRLAGDIDEKLNDSLAAVGEYEEAVHENPSEQNYFAFGSELLLHRAVWQAQEVLRDGVRAWPQSARMQTALGTALFAGARYGEAAKRLCEAADLNPADPQPYLFLGQVEMAAPDSLPCIPPRLERFAQQQPGNAEAQYLYAMAILKGQQQSPDAEARSKAEQLLRTAVTLDDHCADAWLELGILAADQKEPDKSVQLYRKAIAANPNLADAHYRLGVAYQRTGQADRAAEEFRLHDAIVKEQAQAVERQRKEIKQFVFANQQQAAHSAVQ